VPLALQTQTNIEEAPPNPKRWLIVPGGLGASAFLIGAITLPTGIKIIKAKNVDPDKIDDQAAIEAGLQRQKFKALSITGDVLLGAAVVISPLALYQYRKEQKELKTKESVTPTPTITPAPVVVAPPVVPASEPVAEPMPATKPTKAGKTKTTKPK
jgi:hypothetical protein